MKAIKTSLLLLFIAAASASQAQVEYKPKPLDQQPTPIQQTPQTEVDDEPEQRWTGPARQNIIKVNLLSPIYGTIMLYYQHNIRKEASFQLGLGYMDFNGFFGTEETRQVNNNSTLGYYDYKYNFEENTKGVFIMPEYRVHISGGDMRGFFAAPFVKYSYLNYHETYGKDTNSVYIPTGSRKYQTVNEDYVYHSLGVGVIVGHQMIFRNRVSMEFFAGPVYNILLSSSDKSTSSSEPTVSTYMSSIIVRGYGVRAGLSLGFLF